MIYKLRIAYIIAYFSLLFLYFFAETGNNFRRRAFIKITLASLYLIYACAAFLLYSPLHSIRLILLFGLIFFFAGDVALLWKFSLGGVFFGTGNLIMLIYELILFTRYGVSPLALIPAFLVFAAFFGTMMLLFKLKRIDFRGLAVYPPYLASVTLHGSLGIVLAASVTAPAVRLVGFGLFLMMVADYFLTMHEYKYQKKWIARTNTGCYFTGVFLISISMIFPL